MRSVAALSCMIVVLAATAARAADCPGNPEAIGVSRTIAVDPTEHTRVGTMQYPETLPLRDHEVVLTFDDGPVPKNSNQVLRILADQCIKATFFTIGRQAQASPEGVRKLIAVIGDSNNAGSVGVHGAVGFTRVGVIKSCGWKFGKWLDIVMMERAVLFVDGGYNAA